MYFEISTTEIMMSTNKLKIDSDELFFGRPPLLTLRQVKTVGASQLQINPTNAFTNGVLIGRPSDPLHAIFRERNPASGNRMTLGVGISPTQDATVESAGGVRSAKGVPSSADDAFDAGFTFSNDGDSGLFMNG